MQKIMFNDRYGLTEAVIEGRQIMTRRLINPMPKDCATVHKNCWGANWSEEPMSLVVDQDTGGIYCEYCGNGVRFWDGGYHNKTRYKVGEVVAVAQSYEQAGIDPECHIEGGQLAKEHAGWRNKMSVCAKLMPHQIRIIGIKCERLQDITDAECLKEGVRVEFARNGMPMYYYFDTKRWREVWFDTPREAFASLIDRVSGNGTWDRNPWVLAYEFELLK